MTIALIHGIKVPRAHLAEFISPTDNEWRGLDLVWDEELEFVYVGELLGDYMPGLGDHIQCDRPETDDNIRLRLKAALTEDYLFSPNEIRLWLVRYAPEG